MLLAALREEVLEANLTIVRHGLVLYSFGNASGISRDDGLVVIKPSGIAYENARPKDMVVTDLEGNIVEGSLRPSSDLPTHLVLYREFPNIGGVVHTHSEFATAWAQAAKPIPCFGTTHADYFHGSVPVTDPLRTSEIETEYEKNTGLAIARTFESLEYEDIPAVLVAGHGPFCWGSTPAGAAHTAVVLESIARMATYTVGIAPDASAIPAQLRDKHFYRKHGRNAYYGQVGSK